MSDGKRIMIAALEASLDEAKAILFAAETDQCSDLKSRAPELRRKIAFYEQAIKLYSDQESKKEK